MSSFSHGPMKGLLRDLDNRNRWHVLKGSESMISGAGAGLISSIVTCPLDVVKTRLQATGGVHATDKGKETRRAQGVANTFRVIWREEGFRGFYRGLAPTIYGYLPTWAIYFTVYDRVKAELMQKRGTAKNGQDPYAHVIAAMSGGATGTILTNPLWVIKTRFMTQYMNVDRPKYRHTLDAIRQIYHGEGFGAFYKGLLPSLFGVIHVAVQFPLYEYLKSLYSEDGKELPSSTILLCSSLSKAVASVTTYPHEVVRTRLQIQRIQAAEPGVSGQLNLVGIIRRIASNEGVAGFYRGLFVNLARTVPSSAMTILTYELLMRQLNSLTRPEERRSKESS